MAKESKKILFNAMALNIPSISISYADLYILEMKGWIFNCPVNKEENIFARSRKKIDYFTRNYLAVSTCQWF